MRTIKITIDEAVDRELRAMAVAQGRSAVSLFREALQTYLSAAKLSDVRQTARIGASLDQAVGPEGETSLGDLVIGSENTFEDEVDEALTRDQLRKALEELDPLERAVVILRFGLDGNRPASLEATAKHLGIGPRRARRLEAAALDRLADHPGLKAPAA